MSDSVILPDKLRVNDGSDYIRERAYEIAMTGEVKQLLGFARDVKTKKSLDILNVLTGVLYLAPAQYSGVEVCPARTQGCTSVCLFTSGHGVYDRIKIGRLRKTYQFLYRRGEFMDRLVRDIRILKSRCAKNGFFPAVRLNATSDIKWESINVEKDGETYNNIFDAFPSIQFYDYTKRIDRIGERRIIQNYHLTFSYAETEKNRLYAEIAIKSGYNVAVVFGELPSYFEIAGESIPVIDGDITDVRFWDSNDHPVVVGLRAKGEARNDFDSGFVIRDKENE